MFGKTPKMPYLCTMKKFLIFLIVLAVLGLALIATCPSREQHCTTIKGVLSGVINAEMNQKASENVLSEAMASIGTALAINAVDAYVGNTLVLRDYTVCNVGMVSYEGELRPVSFGILNHVFTISEDDARQLLHDKLGEIIDIPEI